MRPEFEERFAAYRASYEAMKRMEADPEFMAMLRTKIAEIEKEETHV